MTHPTKVKMETIDNTPLAAQWVETLLARGVTLKAKGKRLEMIPSGSYGAMSDDEHLTLRHHRAAIVSIVRERYDGTARTLTSGDAGLPREALAPTAAPAPKPALC